MREIEDYKVVRRGGAEDTMGSELCGIDGVVDGDRGCEVSQLGQEGSCMGVSVQQYKSILFLSSTIYEGLRLASLS